MVKKISVVVNEAESNYFFETTEQITVCPNCRSKYYESRTYCLKCKNKLIPSVVTHSGMIKKDLSQYSCDCLFSSFFGWSKHWREIHPKSVCKHLKWALKKIKKEILKYNGCDCINQDEKTKKVPRLW